MVKITDVQACVIGRSVPHSGGSVWTFVRIYTDEGIVGTGECNSAGPARAVKEMVLNMKPLLVGEDPRDVARLYEVMRRRHRYSGPSSAPLLFAISGIEIALWDIAGKALGVPVYRLLGGKYRESIPTYTGIGGATPEAIRDNARRAVEQGLHCQEHRTAGGQFSATSAIGRSGPRLAGRLSEGARP